MSSRTDPASSRAHHLSATRRPQAWRAARIGVIAGCGALAFSWMGPVDAWQQAAAGTCRISGRAVSAGAQRFETLTVQTQAAAAARVDSTETGDSAARLLLPPGFSAEGPTEAVAINGNMASLDRGMMNDRLEAIGRGEFNPTTGEFGQG